MSALLGWPRRCRPGERLPHIASDTNVTSETRFLAHEGDAYWQLHALFWGQQENVAI